MTDDQDIDSDLRRVVVPDNLRSLVRPETLFDDASIDRLVSHVAVPSGLGQRIHASMRAGSASRRDGAIDLSRFATDSRHLLRPDEPSMARRTDHDRWMGLGRDIVSVTTALSLVVLLAWAGIEFSRRLEGVPSRSRAITRIEFDEPSEGVETEDWPLRRPVADGDWRSDAPDRAPRRSPAAVDSLAAAPVTGSDAPSGATAGGVEWAAPPPAVADSQFVRAPDPVGASPERAMIVRGAAASLTSPPSLATVEIPGTVRRRVPRVRGYDLAFEMTTGEQPFIDPAADGSLAIDHPPLSGRVDGFEMLTSNGRGSRDRLPAEDIVAAIPSARRDDPGTRPTLSIHAVRGLRTVAAVPTVLVEVAVAAGPLRDAGRKAEPVDVTLVLDQAAAGDASVWRRMCRGVADLATQLTPGDRVSVVLCGPKPRMAIQAAEPARLADLADDLEWQGSTMASDLDAGLALARSAMPRGRVVVVAGAASLDNAGGTVREAWTAWQNALSLAGGDPIVCAPPEQTRFIVLDPATPTPSEWREPTFGRTSLDAASIRRAMIGQAVGHDTLAASQCHLEVRFDPRRVARYRLVGHRQSAVESLADTPPRGADLHAGETLRVIYEVIPRTPDKLEGLVSAKATWRRIDGSLDETVVSPGRGSADLEASLPSAHGCEIIVAALIGEMAAGSAHVSRSTASVASIERLLAQWRARGDMSPFGEAIARSFGHRSGPRGER